MCRLRGPLPSLGAALVCRAGSPARFPTSMTPASWRDLSLTYFLLRSLREAGSTSLEPTVLLLLRKAY